MSVRWSTETLTLVDHDHDRQSDGTSRYAGYLAQHPDWFRDYDTGKPVSAAQFAASAWRTATGPIMAPGYARIRPDLESIAVDHSEEDPSLLVVTVAVPLRHRDLARGPGSAWWDWSHDRDDFTDHPVNYRRVPPADEHPAVLASADVRFTIGEPWLTASEFTSGPGLVADAQSAVRTLASRINACAAQTVARVQGRLPVYR